MTKIYAWLSGIIVAFIASYLTAVLAAVVPAPKQLLCNLSLGFCSTNERIDIQATDIDKILDRDGVGQGVGQNQIGMLHNRTDPPADRPNMVKYRFEVSNSGKYQLRLFYASAQQRPVEITVNDFVIASNALSNMTGGWDNKHRKWSEIYNVDLTEGENTIMIKRPSVFPHLSKISFYQTEH